jgi:AcrR family transcriptional regulator
MTKPATRAAPRGTEDARRPRRVRGRPSGERTPSTRDALLDATEAIMLDDGYAAVSTRRLAAKAGTDKALIHYYFGTMDDLFIALFRRNAELGAERLGQALASPQPLWAVWDAMHDRSSTALMTEFIALANHRKEVKAVMVENSRKFRRMQLDGLADVLKSYGLDPKEWPPAAVIVLMSSISRYLRTDEAFGVGLGHDETVELVERHIRALEGPRTRSTGRSK